MSLRRKGVEIRCERCEYLYGDSAGGFEVRVPVRVDRKGISGTAILRCVVSDAGQQVELMELLDVDLRPIEPLPEVVEQVSRMLDFMAEHRICGNQRICPADVVRIVEARTGE